MKKGPTTLDELHKWLELNRRGGRKRPRARSVGVISRSVQREVPATLDREHLDRLNVNTKIAPS